MSKKFSDSEQTTDQNFLIHNNSHLEMNILLDVIQKLSLAQDIETIMFIVRKAARKLANSDGATFVLRDNEQCYYADEDAIAPLWKGKRFPLYPTRFKSLVLGTENYH